MCVVNQKLKPTNKDWYAEPTSSAFIVGMFVINIFFPKYKIEACYATFEDLEQENLKLHNNIETTLGRVLLLPYWTIVQFAKTFTDWKRPLQMSKT